MTSKAKFKPQYRRLIFIDEKLRAGGYPNCRSLADEWEVSAKTIQRDLDYLRYELNAPIDYSRSEHGYFYTEGQYQLPALSISESDLFAVMIAEKALRQFRDTPLYDRLVSVFDKIEGALPGQISIQPEWVDSRITFLPDAATHIEPTVWGNIAQALRGNRRIDIEHQSPARKANVTRRVDPYYLVNHRGEWYLIAHSLHHEEIRTFAVSRIASVVETPETFEAPEQFDVDDVLGDHFGIMFGDAVHAVRVRFDARLAPYIRERSWHPEQILKEHRGGGVTLAFPTNHLNEVKDWILAWGAGAEVVGPTELVIRVKEEIAEMRKTYGV